jgi:ribosome-associated translation inhibitor RaiA
MTTSDALAEHIRNEFEKLGHVFPRITSAHAVIEQSHRHHQKGRHFQCHLTVHMPHREIAVTRDPAERDSREDAFAAVDEAFSAARRMVEEHADRSKLEGRHDAA